MDGRQVDEPEDAREAWIERNAAELRRVLADPQIRAHVLGLVAGDDTDARRRKRLQELAQALDGMEVTWKLGSDDGHDHQT
jgi:hypothetical protein